MRGGPSCPENGPNLGVCWRRLIAMVQTNPIENLHTQQGRMAEAVRGRCFLFLATTVTVAVGTGIAPRPPRRSRRALLTHRAPPSGRTSDAERFGRAHRPAHNRQSDRRSSPAPCPDCGRATAVPLGPGPSLHILRRELPPIVRTLLQYYGPVRLLTRVHVQRAALAFLNRPGHK